MKSKIILLVFFVTATILVKDPVFAASGKWNEIQVILGGSGCKGKKELALPLDQNVVSQSLEVPISFQSIITPQKNSRLICQARLVFPNVKNKKFQFNSVKQVFSFLGKKSSVHAALSVGVVKGKDSKIEESLDVANQFSQQLSKKLIDFESSCGKQEIVRLESEVRLKTGPQLKVDVAPATLDFEIVDCL